MSFPVFWRQPFGLVLLALLSFANGATVLAQSVDGQLEWRVRQQIEGLRQRDVWRQLEPLSEVLRARRMRAEIQRGQQVISNATNLAASNAAIKQGKKLSYPGTFSPRARAYSLCEK